jgi:hypothetical protein
MIGNYHLVQIHNIPALNELFFLIVCKDKYQVKATTNTNNIDSRMDGNKFQINCCIL